MHPLPLPGPPNAARPTSGFRGNGQANRLRQLLLIPLALALGGASYASLAVTGGLHVQPISVAVRYQRGSEQSSECRQCALLCSDGKSARRRSALSRVKENVHRRPYEFSCLQTNPCTSAAAAVGPSPLLAVLVVVSAPPNGARRRAIRATWASEASRLGMAVVFLVGQSADDRINRAVGAEALSYGDTIVVNVGDSYGLLTLKTVAMLKWATNFCRQSRYLAKIDDDVFVSLSHLSELLLQYGELRRAIIGRLINGSRVINQRGHKWVNPYYYKHYGDIYPPYACGTSYIMSMDIVPELLAASQSEPFDRMEDVFLTGICASKIGNVTLVAHAGFKPSKNSARVFLDKAVVTAHGLTSEDMTEYWTYLQAH